MSASVLSSKPFRDPLHAVGPAVHVRAHDGAAVGGEVHAVAVHGGRGANAFIGPIDHHAGRKLREHGLPEELAGLFLEAHDDAAIDRFVLAVRVLGIVSRVARAAVVRADENLAAGHDRPAVGTRTEVRLPEHVLLAVEVELAGDVLGLEVDHVAVEGAAEHRVFVQVAQAGMHAHNRIDGGSATRVSLGIRGGGRLGVESHGGGGTAGQQHRAAEEQRSNRSHGSIP